LLQNYTVDSLHSGFVNTNDLNGAAVTWKAIKWTTLHGVTLRCVSYVYRRGPT